MQKISTCSLLILSFVLLSGIAVVGQESKAPQPIDLFASRNLADWDSHFAEPNIKAADIYSFSADGILSCKGLPFGYIATKESYKNFKISVQWRWPEGTKPTNSGVFLRANAQPKESFLPRGFEAQLAHGSAGDLWGFHGMKIAGPKDRLVEKDTDFGGAMSGAKRIEEAELAPGEWNTIEVLCNEGLVVICVNGKIVNWTQEAEATPGKVGLQSEGGLIEMRNCFLTVLP